MKKHPGTAGSMPVKGTGCGIRPDLDELGADTGFDFSAAATLLPAQEESVAEKPQPSPASNCWKKPPN
ncbi:hypothetical protein [Venatoribacter cucullus]|uniref:hypothetical protein n=1 Tax=Venatoribacter cucullus TaxID=2661630 RepID=UPI002240816E|nr:hypothetical protein [Venatoribacter cucullus]UZK03849.1 hypothetical protein GAY96_08060 [Venatoribacter cucullus]